MWNLDDFQKRCGKLAKDLERSFSGESKDEVDSLPSTISAISIQICKIACVATGCLYGFFYAGIGGAIAGLFAGFFVSGILVYIILFIVVMFLDILSETLSNLIEFLIGSSILLLIIFIIVKTWNVWHP